MYRGLHSARRRNLRVAYEIAGRVLCLPIFPGLEMEVVDKICAMIAGGDKPRNGRSCSPTRFRTSVISS
jgi:hypothetical protein